MAQTDGVMTRREWLYSEVLLELASRSEGRWADMGVAWSDLMMAREAVSTTALEHPEWDMDHEQRTLSEWRDDR